MPVLGPEACTAETFEIESPEKWREPAYIVGRHLAAAAETAGQPLVQLKVRLTRAAPQRTEREAVALLSI